MRIGYVIYKKALLFTKLFMTTLTIATVLVGCVGYADLAPSSGVTANITPTRAETFTETPTIMDTNALLIRDYVIKLTSEDFNGRQAGTQGSKLAADWLKGRLADMGIAPYNGGDHFRNFKINRFEVVESDISLTLKDGTVIDYEEGRDYLFYYDKTSFEFTFDINTSGDWIAINIDELDGVEDNTIDKDVILLNGHIDISSKIKDTPEYENNIVIISDEMLRLVMSGDAETLTLINKFDKLTEYNGYNVVGKITGTDSSHCVVVSAHFDHIGENRGSGQSSYYQGAVDNASGTAALLYISEQLLSLTEERKLPFDIIIAFFDAEEQLVTDMMSMGSRFFAREIKTDYESAFNINIDCVGSVLDEEYFMGTPERDYSAALISDIRESLTLHGLNYLDRYTNASDNYSFEVMDIPAVGLISTDVAGYDKIHTLSDTWDKISYEQIVKVCGMVIDFILEKGSTVY